VLAAALPPFIVSAGSVRYGDTEGINVGADVSVRPRRSDIVAIVDSDAGGYADPPLRNDTVEINAGNTGAIDRHICADQMA
jgi:hypothetical protein